MAPFVQPKEGLRVCQTARIRCEVQARLDVADLPGDANMKRKEENNSRAVWVTVALILWFGMAQPSRADLSSKNLGSSIARSTVKQYWKADTSGSEVFFMRNGDLDAAMNMLAGDAQKFLKNYDDVQFFQAAIQGLKSARPEISFQAKKNLEKIRDDSALTFENKDKAAYIALVKTLLEKWEHDRTKFEKEDVAVHDLIKDKLADLKITDISPLASLRAEIDRIKKEGNGDRKTGEIDDKIDAKLKPFMKTACDALDMFKAQQGETMQKINDLGKAIDNVRKLAAQPKPERKKEEKDSLLDPSLIAKLAGLGKKEPEKSTAGDTAPTPTAPPAQPVASSKPTETPNLGNLPQPQPNQGIDPITGMALAESGSSSGRVQLPDGVMLENEPDFKAGDAELQQIKSLTKELIADDPGSVPVENPALMPPQALAAYEARLMTMRAQMAGKLDELDETSKEKTQEVLDLAQKGQNDISEEMSSVKGADALVPRELKAKKTRAEQLVATIEAKIKDLEQLKKTGFMLPLLGGGGLGGLGGGQNSNPLTSSLVFDQMIASKRQELDAAQKDVVEVDKAIEKSVALANKGFRVLKGTKSALELTAKGFIRGMSSLKKSIEKKVGRIDGLLAQIQAMKGGFAGGGTYNTRVRDSLGGFAGPGGRPIGGRGATPTQPQRKSLGATGRDR